MGTVKRVYVYLDLSGTIPAERQTLSTSFSASSAIDISSDGLVVISVTQFVNEPEGSVYFKRNTGGLTQFVQTSVITLPAGTPYGYSLSIVAPSDPVTEQYTTIVGSNPLPVSTTGTPTFFGEQSFYSAFLQENGYCFTEISAGVKWPTIIEENPSNRALATTCGVEGYIPDPNGNVPPFTRDCLSGAIWDAVPAGGGCILPANSCDIEIENNITWPVTIYGATSAGTCAVGTENLSGLPLLRNCQQGGTWSPTLFACTPAQPSCEAIETNNVEWPRVSSGTTARGSCKVAFVPSENKLL